MKFTMQLVLAVAVIMAATLPPPAVGMQNGDCAICNGDTQYQQHYASPVVSSIGNQYTTQQRVVNSSPSGGIRYATTYYTDYVPVRRGDDGAVSNGRVVNSNTIYRSEASDSGNAIQNANHCYPTPCGQNTNCREINGVPTCSCLSGYIGSPLSGCRHECESDGECGNQESCKDFRCQSACSQCGDGAQCVRVQNHRAVCECPKGYIGSPHSSCRPECYGDTECPSGRPACLYGVCKNPCDGVCGAGADCNLRGVTAVCSCPKDMTGDPFVQCRPFTKSDLCSPNPCGTNAQCVPGHDNSSRDIAVCTCVAGYTGDSLSHCYRV